MESVSHRQLKRFAVAFLLRRQCRAVACEVRCPISRYRADVAGYFNDHAPAAWESGELFNTASMTRRNQPKQPATVIIECKQSRADFLHHHRRLEPLLQRRDELQQLCAFIEEHQVKAAEPHLRDGDGALFSEMEQWNFAASESRSYRAVWRKLRQVERKLHGETKFCMIARYCLADRLYIAAPKNLLQPRELPAGWGLLEIPRRLLNDNANDIDPTVELPVEVTVESPRHATNAKHHQRLLHNIAVAASMSAARQLLNADSVNTPGYGSHVASSDMTG